jgi:uncharacterized membrane protein YeaQ/YmgE (transglycosylase-associated protein family)
MGIFLTLLVGGFTGWLASLFMKTDGQQGIALNIVIGLLGAGIGRWLFGGVLHIGGVDTPGSISAYGLLWSVLGACVLIGLLKLVRVLF